MLIKIKIAIKSSLYFLINIFVLSSSKRTLKTALLIRLDAIGDYVLFRNYLEILKKSKKYKDYEITLVGNVAWKSIAEEFDKDFIDKFIWIDLQKFNKQLFYRYFKLKEITSKGYEVVVNSTYSRIFFTDDTIVKLVTAEEKIGSSGDLSNSEKWQKKISDKYYTELIQADNKLMFEFYRHKEFFQQLLNEDISLQKPSITLKSKKLDFILPKNYAILFIGASANFRKWSVENFVDIGKYIKDKYNYEIILCGGPSDIGDAQEFLKIAKYTFVDLTGKTSLIDFLHVVDRGRFMVANETSAPHFAVALEMPSVFVVYNGNHFGRFTPYPKEISSNYYVVYHPKIEKNLENYKKLSNRYGHGSTLDINEITIDMVKSKIDEVLLC